MFYFKSAAERSGAQWYERGASNAKVRGSIPGIHIVRDKCTLCTIMQYNWLRMKVSAKCRNDHSQNSIKCFDMQYEFILQKTNATFSLTFRISFRKTATFDKNPIFFV